jgi:hypothetical protein
MPPEPRTSLEELLAVIGEQTMRIRQLEQYAMELERKLAETEQAVEAAEPQKITRLPPD